MNHEAELRLEAAKLISRRWFFRDCGVGLGSLALASLLRDERLLAGTPPAANEDPLVPKLPHFAAKAKRVIYLFMAGAPSQLDLFDFKPTLVKYDGHPVPAELVKDQRYAFIRPDANLFASPLKFSRHGRSGAELSEVLPHLAEVVDDIAIVKSMNTDAFNHAPAQILMNTGSTQFGRPCMGSWVTYGLGTENENLPGFVVLISSGVQPSGGQGCWGSGFIPSVYQGVQCRSKGDPVLYVSDPAGMNRETRRQTLDAIKDLNELQSRELGHPETATRIAQYELAYRMQKSVPEVMDISKETPATLEAYGAKQGEASFANNCLLARRLVEQGVRFVQLFDWGWDFHGTGPREDIRDGLTQKMSATDKPVAALINDLKQRGLLEDTLIVWGGEFGRTPFREGRTAGSSVLGRDHYPDCFSVMLAGGGIKPGFAYGKTDELGFGVAQEQVHVHDLQATILHQLGFNHEQLTYRFQGRDFRLTDVHGKVVQDILA